VEHFGSEELKKALIPKVCAGEAVVGIAMSEPQAGIRPFRLVFSWDLFLKMLWRFFSRHRLDRSPDQGSNRDLGDYHQWSEEVDVWRWSL